MGADDARAEAERRYPVEPQSGYRYPMRTATQDVFVSGAEWARGRAKRVGAIEAMEEMADAMASVFYRDERGQEVKGDMERWLRARASRLREVWP